MTRMPGTFTGRVCASVPAGRCGRAARLLAWLVWAAVAGSHGCAPVPPPVPPRLDFIAGELRGATDACCCLEDPAEAVRRLDEFGTPREVAGDWPPWAPDGWLRHWQGVQRMDTPETGEILALSFNAEPGAGLAVASVGESGRARLLRVDRVDAEYPHPGGIQALDSFLLVPLERSRRDRVPARVAGLRLTGSGWRRAWTQEVRGTGAAAVAATRLGDGRLLMVTAGWGTRELQVFVSGTSDLEAPGWRELGTWPSADVVNALPGTNSPRDRAWARYQNLNFVRRCGDGALFLLGAMGPVWRWPGGEERVDAFRFQATGDGRIRVTLVARRRLFCAEVSGRRCHPMAGAGFHVTPAGELVVDVVEHGRSGPRGEVLLKTFGSEPAGETTTAP